MHLFKLASVSKFDQDTHTLTIAVSTHLQAKVKSAVITGSDTVKAMLASGRLNVKELLAAVTSMIE